MAEAMSYGLPVVVTTAGGPEYYVDHRVGREVGPRYRGNILLGQLPHNTAVIVEKTGGTKLVVDMWPTAYGQVPDVMPLTKWLEEIAAASR